MKMEIYSKDNWMITSPTVVASTRKSMPSMLGFGKTIVNMDLGYRYPLMDQSSKDGTWMEKRMERVF